MLGRRWRFSFIVAIAVVTVLTFASGIQQSFAHPVYVDSTPGAFESVSSSPNEVRVFFSEAIELPYSSIRVLGPDGSRVDMNDPHNVEGDTASIAATLQPNLPEGEYTVTTRVLSAVDGHIVEETFIFGIGVQTATEARGTPLLGPEYSFSRFPGMVGQVMVVGAAFATLWLWKPLSRVPWLGSAIGQTRVLIDRNMMRLVIIGTGLVLASGVAMIIVQAISIDAGIPEAIATKFGNVWVTRMLQSSILMGIAVAVYRKIARSGNSSIGRAEMYAILILGLAVLVTSSLIAHAAATNQIFPVVLDFFHNAAASIWIGGLILLGFVAVPKILSIGDERIKAAALSILIPRFSTVVVTLLGIAVITGPILLFALESDLSLTVASLYGQILMVKLGLAGAMVAMGAYSQFVVQKRAVMVMAGGGGSAGTRVTGLKHYGKTLKAEAGIGIALLFAVSLMANGALPSGQFPGYERQQDAQSAFAEQPQTDFSRTLYATDGKIQLSISPFAVGQNSFRLSFFNLDGSNATGIESATIKLTQVERGIGPITIETTRQADNVFTANAAFSLQGMWHIEVEGVNTEGSNMLATINTNVKPRVSNLEFQVANYTTPANSLPYYPIFDAARQSIWVGDTSLGSGRIWQFDITTNNYTMHRIPNATLITNTLLAPDGRIWYIDPIGGGNNSGALGIYNPEDNSSRRFVVPDVGVPSGLAMDNNGSLWMPIVQANTVVKFDPASGTFSSYDIPTPMSRPAGIATDRQGNIWFAEAAGYIAKIDPATGNITEYAPSSSLYTLEEPTAVFPDPNSYNIYIADHNGHTILVFNSLLETFREFPSVNENGLPFGMAMDNYGNLWFAEHQIDRLGVIDPRTGLGAEAKIPITGSTIQWITADDRGRIWFAAQRGSALGSVTITAKPATAPTTPDGEGQGEAPAGGIPQLGFTLSDLAGPAIAAGIAISALAYSKSAIDLKRNVRAAMRLDRR